MANWNPSWKTEVGLNHVGAYQVSGQPYASGNLDCGNAKQVEFPYVTRWFQVINREAFPVRVGFSQLGVSGSNYFTCPPSASAAPSSTGVLEAKVSEVWLYSPGNPTAKADVVAGLTSVPRGRTTVSSSTDGLLPSWSGSVGVG